MKPPAGVTVIVEVFPVAAPGAGETGPPEMVNPLTVSESGTEGDVSPLLALIVRPNDPMDVEDVVAKSKATAANPQPTMLSSRNTGKLLVGGCKPTRTPAAMFSPTRRASTDMPCEQKAAVDDRPERARRELQSRSLCDRNLPRFS